MEFCIFFRFFFKSNDSILGATSSNSLKVPEKPDVSSRPRIKVHASQRKAAQRQQSQSTTTQPLVNGDRVEEDSLMYISDISAIHDTRSNNLPGLSKKVSIGNFSVSVYGLYEPKQDKNLFCICENKDRGQLHGNHAADKPLCFCYIDSTIPPLPKSEISRHSPEAVQPGFCRPWS